jgi:branched-chain amino acid transport system permease protein
MAYAIIWKVGVDGRDKPGHDDLSSASPTTMHQTIDAVVSIGFHGLAFAMVLYLISVGLSVTMGMMGLVNLAHGAFAMLGGYVMTNLMNRHGVPFVAALAGGAVAAALASVVLERLLYRRFYGGDELDQVLLTMGLIYMSIAGATYVWGPLTQPMQPPRWLSGQIDLGVRSFPAYRSFLILCGAGLVTALWLGLERTRFGARVRAAVDNLRMAQSVGINTSLLFVLTFALGSGLAGLGGALGADQLQISPAYPLQYLVYFIIVVAVGGLGTIRGPFVAALLIGVADTAFKYLVPGLGAFFIYALTMALLLWRPQGLFGRA